MTTEPEVIISVKNGVKIFRDFWLRPHVTALRDLTLDVRRGDVFGLLGPNGSGKSTTIKMLLGLLKPTAGEVRIFGKPPHDPTVRARMGYLPELSFLHPFLTARETLRYYGGLCNLSRREAASRADQLLEMLALTDVANRAVGGFSKGMARRVALAASLVSKPELLILDEPTSGLDPISTNEVKTLVKGLAKNGMTILMSSHLLGDTQDICNRFAILDRGEKKVEGHIEELKESLNTFFLSQVGEGRDFDVAPFLAS